MVGVGAVQVNEELRTLHTRNYARGVSAETSPPTGVGVSVAGLGWAKAVRCGLVAPPDERLFSVRVCRCSGCDARWNARRRRWR